MNLTRIIFEKVLHAHTHTRAHTDTHAQITHIHVIYCIMDEIGEKAVGVGFISLSVSLCGGFHETVL